MSSALAALEKVISDYFDALYHCDTDLLQQVFHEKAIYATADETPSTALAASTNARQSPASRGEERRDVIDEIQFAGENTAFARVRCSIGTNDFTDFLTFVRDEGRWQIMAKIFEIRPRNEGVA